MSRNVNVSDNATVLVLTPKQTLKLEAYIRGQVPSLDPAVTHKILDAADGVRYDELKRK